MRNYLRYIAYVWRYKARVIASFVASAVFELLGFASVVAFIGCIELLYRLHRDGVAGKVGQIWPLSTPWGKGFIEITRDRVSTPGGLVLTILYTGLWFLGLAAIQAVLEFSRRYLLDSASMRGWTDMMRDLFARLARLSMRFYSSQRLGHTMATFGPDTSELSNSGRMIFHHVLSSPLRLFIGLGAAFIVSWKLSLATMFILPIAAVLFKIVGDRLRRYTRKSLEQRADTMKVLGEMLQGATVIKAYCAEEYQIGRYNESAGKMLSYGLRRALVHAFSRPGTGMVYWTFRIGVMIYGMYLVIQDVMSITHLCTFIYALKQIYDPLGRLRDLNNDIQRSRAAADRVFALMDMEPEIAEKPDAQALPRLSGAIRFDHVGFAYDPPHEVVHDFDLTIQAGETVALVGENGSGKSTLVKLLLRFYDPTSGAVSVDGHDLRDVTLRSLRGQIGYMPQEVALFNDTVSNNIAFGLADTSQEDIEAAARTALAHDFIVNELPDGYDTVVGEGGTKLSGGQRQRIALARALLRDPSILILDEPTSSMDADVEHRLHDELGAFAEGRTLILIAHRFAVLRRCDRIIAIANGRIEHIGTHTDMLAHSPTYRNLHDKQSGEAHEKTG